MQDCFDRGLAKSIGLSNFNSLQIQSIYDSATVKPSVLQVECHAYFSQRKLLQFCTNLGIILTAYGPIGSPGLPAFVKQSGFVKDPTTLKFDPPVLLDDATVKALATKYNKTPAQILLRWLIERNIVVIPKSASPTRIVENFAVFDFKLAAEDSSAIDAIDQNYRMFKFDFNESILKHPDFPFLAEF